MSIDVMSYIWKHSPSKGSELLLLLALADYASHDGTAHPSVKHLAEKCRMTERNVQLLFKNLVASKQVSIKFGQGPHGCHLFRLHLPKDVTHLVRGEKFSGEMITDEKISPQSIIVDNEENQTVISNRGEMITDEKISPEKISWVKSSALLQPQISPLPSVDPLREDLPPISPLTGGIEVSNSDVNGPTVSTAKGEARVLQAKADHVLAYLNSLLGRNYSVDRHIKGRLRKGATLDDCKLVIDWLHVVRREAEPEWVEKCLDHTTPFREDNFDKYLQRAKEWQRQRSAQSVTKPHNRPYMG
jgi:uncharacterized phage protein (TIGR02220 family)